MTATISIFNNTVFNENKALFKVSSKYDGMQVTCSMPAVRGWVKRLNRAGVDSICLDIVNQHGYRYANDEFDGCYTT